jgi:hypothetical protein
MLKYIILIFIILLIIEYFVYNYFQNKKKLFYDHEYERKQIENNKNNKDELISIFKNTIQQRLHILENMEYTDWLKYNQKNDIITNNGIKYNIFIYEKSDLENDNAIFINRCNYPKEFNDQNYLDVVEQVTNKSSILEIFPPNKNLLTDMFNMNLYDDGFNNISYNWYNFFTYNPVLNSAIFTKFDKNNIQGVIGISYTKEYLDLKYNDININFISHSVAIFLHLILLLVSCSIFLLSKHIFFGFFESVAILLVSWLFLVYQLFLSTSVTNNNIENSINISVYNNLIAVAYLLVVPISLISYIKKKPKKMIFLLCISVFLLFLSLIKFNSYIDLTSLRVERIQNQIFFNLGLFYFFWLLFIFLIYFFLKKD